MITAIIQARMNSTRLPGKIMTRFAGNNLLGHIIERLTFSKNISSIVVATTVNETDTPVVEWAESNNLRHFRGSEADVLNRYFEAAKFFNATHIARITADDPFKDPEIIDAVSDLYLKERLDFAYNNKPPTFAEGLDTEIFSFEALKTANQEAKDPFEREHVTQYFYRHPEMFKQKNVTSPVNFSHLRWTIDTPEDLRMAEVIYENLYASGKIFLANDILQLLKMKPEIACINQDVNRSAMYKKIDQL